METITPDWLQWGFGGILLLVLVGGFLLARALLTKTIEQAAAESDRREKEGERREAREERMQAFLETMVKAAGEQAQEQTAAWRALSQEGIAAQQANLAAQREQVAALHEISEALKDHHTKVVTRLYELQGG